MLERQQQLRVLTKLRHYPRPGQGVNFFFSRYNRECGRKYGRLRVRP